MSPGSVARMSGRWALFLDVDGTLLEIAETPSSVYVSDELRSLLLRLSLRLDGALALISGRSIDDLDALFAPLQFCASGVHGCERRETNGSIIKSRLHPHALMLVRDELEIFVKQRPGLVLEDKGAGVALHYRQAPHLSGEVLTLLRGMCKRLGPQFRLQAGKYVLEVRPSGYSKGSAIAEFMTEAPFVDRTPIFIGDDITDEDGFSVVNRLGGLSIKVGEQAETLAKHRLENVSEVLQWLEALPSPLVASV
jgi:trehalose 6-phosphate phosphatase